MDRVAIQSRPMWLCRHTNTTHVAVLPYQHDPYDPWPCSHTITTHGRVAIPSRPMAVLPYHHDPWLCCHTITILGPLAPLAALRGRPLWAGYTGCPWCAW